MGEVADDQAVIKGSSALDADAVPSRCCGMRGVVDAEVDLAVDDFGEALLGGGLLVDVGNVARVGNLSRSAGCTPRRTHRPWLTFSNWKLPLKKLVASYFLTSE